MPVDMSIPNSIINAYLQGARIKQQREAQNVEQQQRQQQLDQGFKLAQDQLKQQQDQFNVTHKYQAAQQAMQAQQAKIQLENHYVEQMKGGVNVNPQDYTSEYQPGVGEVNLPNYTDIQAREQSLRDASVKQAGAQAGAIAGAQEPYKAADDARALQQTTQQGLNQLGVAQVNQLAAGERNDATIKSRESEGAKNRSNAAMIAAKQIAARKEIANTQHVSQVDDYAQNAMTGEWGLDDFKAGIGSTKQRDAVIGTLQKNGIKVLTKTQKAELQGLSQLTDIQNRQKELAAKIKDPNAKLGDIYQGIASLEGDAGQIARTLGAEKGALSAADVTRQSKRLIGLGKGMVGKMTAGKIDANEAAINEMQQVLNKHIKRLLGGMNPEQQHAIADRYGLDLGIKEVKE